MESLYVNHLAVFVCALLSLALGALWYSPVMFYRGWLTTAGLTEDRIKADFNPAKTYGLAFLLAWVMSYNLAFFLGDAMTDAMWGATAGFLAGFGWCLMAFGIVALFEKRSLKYVLINGGYITIYLTLTGLILGGWR